MPTQRQKKLAEVIIQNATVDKPLNAVQMLEKVGYSKNMAEARSKDVLESEGVREALNDFGFNENNAKRVVAEILLDTKVDPGNRLRASQEVFKVHGSYAPEKSTAINLNLNNKIENSEAEAIRLEFEQKLKDKLLQ